MEGSGNPVEISVIVPAFRAESTIGACLAGLEVAGFEKREIVVVDDGSDDDTVRIVRDHGIEPLQPGGNQGAAQARNAGVAASTGDILVFVDSDVVVRDDVRARIEAFFTDHPHHAGVFGSYDDAPPAPARVSRIRNLLHHHVHQRAPGPATTFWTGFGALRRADFELAGGFRTEDEMIEDVGLGLRLAQAGRPVMLDPGLLCTHLKEWDWRGFLKTDYRHRAQPWTRMMLDPTNGDAGKTLNAGARGRAAVVAAGLGVLAIPLVFWSTALGIGLAIFAIAALVLIERGFLALVLRRGDLFDVLTAIAVLWTHYVAAGAGYARVRLFG